MTTTTPRSKSLVATMQQCHWMTKQPVKHTIITTCAIILTMFHVVPAAYMQG
jgi:hypothetical protein